jgi:hypothetical protein
MRGLRHFSIKKCGARVKVVFSVLLLLFMSMVFEFVIVEQPLDFEIAKNLFRAYAETLNFDLGFQNFERELSEIAVQYNKPLGGADFDF